MDYGQLENRELAQTQKDHVTSRFLVLFCFVFFPSFLFH